MPRINSRLRAALILVLALALTITGCQVVAMPRAVAAPAAPYPGCPPETSAPGATVQCVAETPLTTRQRLATNCFGARELQPDALYDVGDCIAANTIQAEAIGQARAITQYNQQGVFGDSAPLGLITPNLQWEVTIPGGRPDIVLYDRTTQGSPVYLIEAKMALAGRGDGMANAQLVRYLNSFPSGPTNRPIRRYNVTGYSDTFRIQVRKCAGPGTREVINHYTVSGSTSVGVMIISDAQPEIRKCGDDPTPTATATATETATPTATATVSPSTTATATPTNTVQPPVLVPPGSGDDESDWDKFLDEHPELQDIPWPDLKEAALAAGVGVVLVAGIAACLATGVCEALAAAMGAAVLAEEGAAAIGTIVTVAMGALAALIGWNIFGEPHIATLDGFAYDLQSVGEFHLLQAPDANLDIQARFTSISPNLSRFSALAFEINDNQIELNGTSLLVNGAPVSLPAGGFYDLGGGAGIMRGGRGNSFYDVVFPGTGDRLLMMWNGSNVGFHVPAGLKTKGLLGNHNGNPLDDLALSDGTPLPANSSPTVLHGRYADSWRVTDLDSDFSYATGESTATYTDRAFPADVVTIGDFTEAEIAVGTDTCQQAGVLPGPQFEDCVFDVVATGDDSYAESAAGVTTALVDASDHYFDDSGDLAEGFEGTVGANFAAPHYFSDPSTTRMAGPLFDTPGYTVRARTVGRHQTLRVRADLYAFGNIGSDDVPQTLSLTLDGTAAGTINFDGTDGPSLSGGLTGTIERTAVNTTEAGTPYSKYALDITLPHTAASVDLQFTPKYFRGVLDTSLGIDNIDLTLAIPPANTFDVALPLTVPSDQAPAAQGAGVIEVAGGQDAYRFTLDAPAAVAVQLTSCTAAPTVTVVNTGTGDRTPLLTSCGSVLSPVLPAGSYRLELYTRSASSYALSLYLPPAAQPFALGTVTAPVTISDGTPAAGAGNLETALSRDDYSFTLPAAATVAFDFSGTAAAPRWSLTKPDGSSTGGSGNARLENLPAGDYQLRVGDLGSFGTAGSYRLVLTPAVPQSFDLGALPTTAGSPVLADGVPAAGAGRLESAAAEDDYTLTVPSTGAVELDWACGTTYGYLNWTLSRADGSTVATNTYCSSQVLPNLAAGAYRLVVKPQWNYAGSYSLTAGLVPAPQSFGLGTLTGVTSISDGVPAVGAGRLESRTSVDEYDFTLGSSQSVFADFGGSSFGPLTTLLRSDGSTVAQVRGNYRFQALPAGDYRLLLGNAASPDTAGAYQLVLTPAVAQSFALGSLAAPAALVSDGVPASGAGRLESKAAEDDYTLTVPSTGAVELDWSCSAMYGYLSWTLLKPDGSSLYSSSSCSSLVLQNVAAGDYRLVVKPQYEYIGSYTLTAGMAPAAQVFSLGTLSSTATISDGVPAAGAGKLEYRTSRDEYDFTLSTAETVFADFNGSPFAPLTTLLRSDGSTVAQVRGNYRFQALPAGDYRLLLGNAGSPDTAGAYQLVLIPAATQSFALGSLAAPAALIADGVPGSGAGRMESKAAEDDYTLTVPSTGAVELDWSCNAMYGYLSWTLLKPDGSSLYSSSSCSSLVLSNVAAGDYRIVVKPQYEYLGAYSLTAGLVPAAQVFALGTLSGSATISDGLPTAGAGKLEFRTSVDEYDFTLASSQSVFADFTGSSFAPLTTLLRSDGSTVAQVRGNYRFQALPAGDYRLLLGNAGSPDTAGAYQLVLTPANVQTFALGVLASPAALIADGVPGSGAGRMESKAAEDDYTLTVPNTGAVELDWSCNAMYGYLSWTLLKPDGSSLYSSSSCSSLVLQNVAAGDYRIVVKPQYEYLGAYSLTAGMVPAAQVFALGALSSPATISDGAPTAGAGKLEFRTSVDEYDFTLPTAETVFADFNGSPFAPLATLLRADGSTVSQVRGNYRFQALPAGDYRLLLGNAGSPDTAGAYQLVLTPAAVQSFALGSLGAPTSLIADGVPGSGAGRMESKAAEDDYTLTVPSTGQVELDWSCSPMYGYLSWTLLKPDGSSLYSSSSCSSLVLSNVAAGDYRIVVKPQYEYLGAYSLTAGMVPAAQVFALGALSGSATISDGTPAAGAGRLEYRTSVDEYDFTLPATETVFADFNGSPFAPLAVLLRSDGSTVAQVRGNYRFQALPAGDYRLLLGNAGSPDTAGAYQLVLTPAVAQSFALGSLAAPAALVSDGVPAAGAGRMESKAAEDDYTFTVSSTGAVELDWSCNAMYGYLNWTLLKPDGSSLYASSSCSSLVLQNVAAGNYRMVVKPQYEYLGAYSLTAGMVPAAQVFSLGSLSSAVTISDGIPAAGAGKLEFRTSVDEYDFTLGSTLSVFADFGGSSFAPLTTLLRSDGSTVAQVRGNYLFQSLPAGSYRLLLGNAGSPDTAGAYHLVLNINNAQYFSLGTLSAPAQLVADQVPGSGAGRLESKAAEDDYTLTVPSTGPVELDWSCSAMYGYLNWTLLKPDGTALYSSSSCSSLVLQNVAAGDYRLVVKPQYEYIGPYTLTAGMVPSAQVFGLGSLAGAVSISNGVPTTGAGKLEFRTSVDEYDFTLPATETVFADFNGSPFAPLTTLLRADGSTVAQVRGNYRFQALPAGDYRLLLGNATSPDTAGVYQLVLTPAVAQSFALGSLAAPAALVSDGVPASGAGRMESKAAEDDYTITVPSTGPVELDWSCSAMYGYLSWTLLKPDGSSLYSSSSCSSLVLPNVAAGDYRIVVKPQYEYLGAYSLTAGMVPATQVFALGSLAAATTISNGVPTTGAGKLEFRTSIDEYDFTLPATETVFADFNGSPFAPLATLLRADGSTVAQVRGNYRFQALPAGDYRLLLGNATSPDTAGAYQLVLTPAAAQSFALGALADPAGVVSDGVPAAGAGRMESKAAEDDYTLTVPSTGAVELDWSCNAMYGYLSWTLLKPDGSSLYSSSSCSSLVLSNVAAGDYRIIIKPQYEYLGAYSLTAGMVPATQVFPLGTLTAANSISDGVPATGAGRLEFRTSRDEYDFTLPATETVFADFNGSPFAPLATLLRADGSTVAQVRGNYRFQALPAGDYRLLLGNASSPDTAGAYQMVLTPAAAQSFALGTLAAPASLVSDGVPAAGAGRMESKASEDDYTFTVSSTGPVELDWSCNAMYGYLSWTLLKPDGSSLYSSSSCSSLVLQNVAAGNYRIVVKPQYEYLGAYSLTAGMVPATQPFDLGSLLTTSIADGTPTAGAGRLEYRTSVDEYDFTLPATETVFADFNGSPFAPLTTLLRADGSTVAQVRGNYRFQSLAAGSYRLLLGNASSPDTAGAYQVVLTPAVAQSFALGTLAAPTSLVSDGIPAAGAGRMESKAAEDDYTFTVSNTGALQLNWSCGSSYGYLSWTLLKPDGSSLYSSSSCSSLVLQNVAAGNYRIVVKPQYEYLGTYTLTAGMQ